MIEKINSSNVNKNGYKPQKNQPQFKGLDGAVNGVLQAVQALEQNPMANVAFLDVTTAIAPRTIVESQTNAYAGFEALRRESSGLIVNCLLPGFAVWGIAKALEGPIMGDKSKMGSCWANEETIKMVSEYWKKAEGEGREKVSNTIRNMMNDFEGLDGNIDKGGIKSFNGKVDEAAIEAITDNVYSKNTQKAVTKAYKDTVDKIHISEHIRLKNGKFMSQNLSSVFRDTPNILKEFVEKKITSAADVDELAKKATKLVNAKSLIGLGLIIPLAISMQPINRFITAKMSGKKGAPIYKDYSDSKPKELTPKEKADLLKQKFISVGTMCGFALLSMMKIPNMQMFQFGGKFATMDQARLVSTSTFASRMMASEDKNDLREATVRDIATFSSLYFLGDYASKGLATLIEKIKPEIKLLNTLKNPKEGANIIQKFGNWVKNTSLKSSEEVVGEAAKRMRSACQLANIGFSLLLLGLFIPLYTRHKTDKRHAEELKKTNAEGDTGQKFYHKLIVKSPNIPSKANTYQEFFTSK